VNYANRYGLLDRMLHRLAFATRLPQAAVADLEERVFRSSLEPVAPSAPVLITALPRGGTTILLEVLASTPTFASHTYRDMPFILCPMMWDKISRGFRRDEAPRPRAHDDGIQISPDSPEAFEEVIWMRFWPEQYRRHAIAPWTSCDRDEFVEFFSAHMRKIVALRRREKPTASRYVSKNNLNVARIPAIWDRFPSAIVVVPFREPLQHAASLLRQHRRFAELHAKDPFSKRYMAGIGHFDFGMNLKPVNFDGWLDRAEARDPFSIQFWLEYWLATYRHVLREKKIRPRLALVRGEAMRSENDTSRLAEAIELEDPGELRSRQGVMKHDSFHQVDASALSGETLKNARGVFEELSALSVL
jgi:hypothetical protein